VEAGGLVGHFARRQASNPKPATPSVLSILELIHPKDNAMSARDNGLQKSKTYVMVFRWANDKRGRVRSRKAVGNRLNTTFAGSNERGGKFFTPNGRNPLKSPDYKK
jgi:hypothetical protein